MTDQEKIDKLCLRLRTAYLSGIPLDNAARLDMRMLDGLLRETGLPNSYAYQHIFGEPTGEIIGMIEEIKEKA